MPSTLTRVVLACASAFALIGSAPAIAAEAPGISAVSVSKLTSDEAVISAGVNPQGAATTTRLEFGATAALGARTNAVDLPAGNDPVLVTMTLSGLKPSTTYHYRFTATNELGTTTTEVQSLRTPARDATPTAPTAPAPTMSRVLPSVRLSFAIATQRSGTTLGRILGATRPQGLPIGTKVSIRCRTGCRGQRSFTTSAQTAGGLQVRFSPAIRITRRSVVEIRATRAGYTGRIQRYVFRRSGVLIAPKRTMARCLTRVKALVVKCPTAPGAS